MQRTACFTFANALCTFLTVPIRDPAGLTLRVREHFWREDNLIRELHDLVVNGTSRNDLKTRENINAI
jgi:hypothetical protein